MSSSYRFVTRLIATVSLLLPAHAVEAAWPQEGDVLVISSSFDGTLTHPYVFAVNPGTKAKSLVGDLITYADPEIYGAAGPLTPIAVAMSRDGVLWVAYGNSNAVYSATLCPNGGCGGVVLRINADGTHEIVKLAFGLFPTGLAPAPDGSVVLVTGHSNLAGMFRLQAIDATNTSLTQFAVPQTLFNPGCATPVRIGYEGFDPVTGLTTDNLGRTLLFRAADGTIIPAAQAAGLTDFLNTLGQPTPIYTDSTGHIITPPGYVVGGNICDFDAVGFKQANGVAVDQTTGDIYVGDVEGGLRTQASVTIPYCEQVGFADCGALYRIAPGTVIGSQKTLISDFGNPSQGTAGEDAGMAVALSGAGFLVSDSTWWLFHDLQNSATDPCGVAGAPPECNIFGAIFRVAANGTRTLLTAYGDSTQGQTGGSSFNGLPMAITLDGTILLARCDGSSGVGSQDSICAVDPNTGFRTLWSDFGVVDALRLRGALAISVVLPFISKTSTTTDIASSVNPSAFGQSVTFTATVTGAGATPTGQVTFSDGATVLNTVSLASGVASFSTAALATGAHTITASYSGDGTFATSHSAPLMQTVSAAMTATSLASNLNPASAGQPITVTATVTPQFPGTLTGSVTFQDAGATLDVLPLSGGSASLTLDTLVAGTHPLTAVYSGDTNFAGSSSAVVSETIDAVTTTTTLAAFPNPVYVGSATTLTALVTPASAFVKGTGSVTFTIDGTDVATTPVANQTATFVANGLSLGGHTVVATYVPDTTNLIGSKSATVNVTVQLVGTTTVLQIAPNPSTLGAVVTLTATVTAAVGTPAGTVTFFDGGAALGSPIPIPAGGNQVSLPASGFGVGTHTISAHFTGAVGTDTDSADSRFLTVNRAASAITLTATPTTSSSGQAVSMQAVVSSPLGGIAAGTITFMADGATLGTESVAGNRATFSTEWLGVGTHALTATYSGDVNLAPVMSAPVSETVQYAVTSPSRSASPNPRMDYYGGPVVSSPEVRVVFWGAGVDGTVQANIGDFFTKTLGGSFADVLTEYSTIGRTATAGANAGQPGSNQVIGRGRYAGSVSIAPSICAVSPCLVFDDQIQAEINRQIASGVLASPTYDASGHPDTLFMIYFPAGVTINAGTPASPGPTSCDVFLSYHGTGTTADGRDLLYAAVPDLATCDRGPFANPTPLDDVTLASSHELAEMITDASILKASPRDRAPLAWYSTQQSTEIFYGGSRDYGEIGDVCDLIAGQLNGYTVQLVWSNQQNACVLASAAPPPPPPPIAPSIAKAFSPTSVVVGEVSHLIITITNPNSDTTLDDVAFVDPLPAGMSPAHSITNLCGGSLDIGGAVDSLSINLTRTTLAAMTSCQVIVDVTSTVAGDRINTTQPVTSSTAGTGNAATATLTVLPILPATIAKAFSPATIDVGTTSRLTFTLTNPNATLALDTVNFLDPLPDGLIVVGPGPDSCGGGGVSPGELFVAYTIQSMPAGRTCQVSVDVVARTAGTKNNATRLITSTNGGVGNFATATLVVNARLQSIAIAPANPSVSVGTLQAFTATGTYTDGSTRDITGIVTWTSSAAAVATIAATGTASAVGVGPSTIGAASGAVTGSTVLTVTRAVSTTTLASSIDPVMVGQSITLTAAVSGYRPTGSVTFFDGAAIIGTGAIGAGGTATLTLKNMSAGVHSITAAYAGDADNMPSTSTALSQVVNTGAGKTTTSTTLASSENPAPVGQPVTLTAIVTGAAPGGQVTFADAKGTLGTASLVNGVATLTVTSLSKGAHQITATYGGDSQNLGSTSPRLKEQIQ